MPCQLSYHLLQQNSDKQDLENFGQASGQTMPYKEFPPTKRLLFTPSAKDLPVNPNNAD